MTFAAMRSVGSLFHAAPSNEFTTPPLGGMQHVWKRVFEHVMDRGDTYKRGAFNSLHDKSRLLDEDTYADLRVSHDALSIERDVLTDAYHNPTNLSLDLVSGAHAYKNRAKLLYKDVLKALESAPPSPPSSRQDSLVSYRFPGSPPATPPKENFQLPSGYLNRAQRMTDSSLSINVLYSSPGLSATPLQRSRQVNAMDQKLPEASHSTLSCSSLTDNFAQQQYHMYVHENLPSSGSVTTTSQYSGGSRTWSDRISASEVVELLDNINGDIDIDAVVDLLQMAEGSADESLLSHAVQAMKAKYGESAAERLQSELDDRVRASSSSGARTSI